MEPRDLRRLAGRVLVAGLCVSAAVAVVALLSGSFDEVHWRVVGTSLGFSVFTSAAATGAALRPRDHAGLRLLGLATMGASALALVLFVAALWIDAADGLWRGFGIAGLLALWTSHGSIMLGALRPGDSPAVRILTQVSAVTLGVETCVGVGAILEVVPEVSDAFAQVLAALVVVTVLATVLPPLLRRLQQQSEPDPVAALRPSSRLAAEVAASAGRLAAMDLPPQARAEVDHLRRVARDAGA